MRNKEGYLDLTAYKAIRSAGNRKRMPKRKKDRHLYYKIGETKQFNTSGVTLIK